MTGRTRAAEALLVAELRHVPADITRAREVEAELARSWSNLIVREASRLASRFGLPAEDLVQVGMLEALLLARRFRPAPGRDLGGSYVAQVARQAMQRHAQDTGSLVYVPRTVRKRARRARLAAQVAGLPLDQVLRGRELSPAAVEAVDLATSATPAPVAALLRVAAGGAAADCALEEREQWAAVQAAIGQLTKLQRHVLMQSMGFGCPDGVGLPDTAMARALRLSPEDVRRTREAALRRLREALGV